MIVNRPIFELPIKTQKDYKSLTVGVSILPNDVVEVETANIVTAQPSTTDQQPGSESEKIPAQCIQDAANFISLPPESQELLKSGQAQLESTPDETVHIMSDAA